MNFKHAYLIIAHNQFDILEKLIKMLDDKRNDIFIHIDKKVSDFDFDYFKKLVKKSNIYFTDRTDVRWGGYSQINCEYILLKKACETGKYFYYHIISGCDLPIQTQDYIHDFFKKINGKQVIQLTTDELIQKNNAYYRISRYHFFDKSFRTNNLLKKKLLGAFNFVVMPLQRILKVDRLHKKIKIGYGANWVSITDSFARYVIEKEDWVKKHFKHSKCADELFMQTLIVNSKFSKDVYSEKSDNFNGDACMRYIDWKRGNPYTLRVQDYDSLVESNMLFARKFNSSVDNKIIEKIYNKYK